MATQPQTQLEEAEQAYNYERFSPSILGKDFKLIRGPEGPLPGDSAPNFILEDVDGQQWELNELRGRPVVLIFGSGTCPLTAGSLPGLKALYHQQVLDAQWLLVYVREAHPGESMRAHHTFDQKREQARRLRDQEHIPWPVLVDQLDGSVHQAYGSLPNHIFLLDNEGRVAFRGAMAHAPSLRRAIEERFEKRLRAACT